MRWGLKREKRSLAISLLNIQDTISAPSPPTPSPPPLVLTPFFVLPHLLGASHFSLPHSLPPSLSLSHTHTHTHTLTLTFSLFLSLVWKDIDGTRAAAIHPFHSFLFFEKRKKICCDTTRKKCSSTSRIL